MAELTRMPSRFSAGTTVKYTRNFATYPAGDGWTLDVHLRGKGTMDVSGNASGNSFEVELTAAQTASLASGVYRWVERVSKGAEVFDVDRGTVVVTIDLAAAAAGDAQSQDEKDLEVIEAVLSGRITSGLESYEIAGRAVTKIPIRDLYRLRARLRESVWRQRNRGKASRVIKFRPRGTGV